MEFFYHQNQEAHTIFITIGTQQETIQSQDQKKLIELELNQNDKLQWQQQINYPNGDIYVGEIQNGLPQGQGIIIYSKGNSWEGQFVQGKRQGKGVKKYKNGKCFEYY